MLKKFKTATSIMISFTLFFMCSVPALAVSPPSSTQNNITLSTKITKNNLNNVLIYLGIDPSKKITINDKSKIHNVTTVNDLKILIDKVKAEASSAASATPIAPITSAVSLVTTNKMTPFSTIGLPSKVASISTNVSYYTLTNSICAQYDGKSWKKLCWEKCSLSQPSFTVGYYSLKSTTYYSNSLTSSLITTKSTEIVDSYAGISVFGVPIGVPTAENSVNTTCYYYASVWL